MIPLLLIEPIDNWLQKIGVRGAIRYSYVLVAVFPNFTGREIYFIYRDGMEKVMDSAGDLSS